jgi:hypothetical protein
MFPPTFRFEQKSFRNTMTPSQLDTLDVSKPRNSSLAPTGGQACRSISDYTLKDATNANTPNPTMKHQGTLSTQTEFLPNPGHISSDLITGLPESDGHNAILVVVNRFSKMIVLIPIRDTLTAPQMAENFRDHIWKRFGMPEQIISDRGPQYIAQFTKDLYQLMNTTTNISTAFHPQTDGQTERINQEVEQYLCLFINY